MKQISLLLFVVFILSCEKETKIRELPDVEWNQEYSCSSMKATDGEGLELLDCVEFSYTDEKVLQVQRLNAGFNCCPSRIFIDVEWSGDTLWIRESEKDAYCDCNCLYDIEYKISPVEASEIIIAIEEPYVNLDRDELLVFPVNLKEEKNGRHCFDRSGYPWK